MKANLLFNQRIDYDDGAIVEMAHSVTGCVVTRGLKYSLFYGRQGIREVGCDSEYGKGVHRYLQVTRRPTRSAASSN